ncbi:MAG: FtsW/RodA/SpoVE family cell cycle protein [Micrococcales bacterium]|nr:FtsW/RodA/SpoVE family cell cycle protein [Micrococcales bacterium]
MATVQTLRVRSGRGVELGLLLLAVAVGWASYALVGLGTAGRVPAGALRYGLGMAAMGLGMHLVLRWRARYADPVILPVCVAINGIGLAMIYRIDVADHTDYAAKQLQWTAISLVLAALVLIVLKDHRTLRRYTYTAMVAGLALLVSPLLPGIGKAVYGARIWVHFGSVVQLQPAELAKIALAMFFAGYLVTNRDTLALAGPRVLGMQLPRLRDLGPILVVWVVSVAVLVFQGDLGTSLLLFGLFVAMLYLATERVSWVLIGMVLFGVGAWGAAVAIPHVGARFTIWLHALDPTVYAKPGGSWQLVQGLFGLASGGLFGTGWGQGRPEIVTFAQSDFIVTSVGEELGLTGLVAILLLYAVLTERGLRTAIGVRDGFGKLLTGGLAFVMAFQVFVVVGGVTRIIPLTGLTTPLLAYGGSSLLANWVIVALLLRTSDDARRPTPVAAPPSGPTPVVPAPGAIPAMPAGDDQPTERPGGAQ